MHIKGYLNSSIFLSGLAIALSSSGVYANQNQADFTDAMDTFCEDKVVIGGEGGFIPDDNNPPDLNFATLAATAAPEDISSECASFVSDSTDSDYLAQATPDEAPALYTSLVQLSSDQISNISRHLTTRRSSQKADSSESASYPSLQSYYGGAASSDLLSNGRLSVFLNGAFLDGDQDDTDYEVGYDLSTDHYTLGIDYRLSNDLLIGFAYGSSDTELEYNQFGDTSENNTDHYILYTSWYRDNFAVDATLGFASGEFDTLRHMPDDNVAVGSTDNDMTYLSIAGSYDFSQGGWTYGPRASLDWLSGDIDGFSESGDSVWAASFDDQEVDSMILAMGGYASYAASFNWGVLVPHARAEWRNEFEDDRDLIVGQFVNDPTKGFDITPDDPDTSWFQASVGVSAVFTHGISAFVDYEQIISYNDTDLSIVSAGARLEF